MMNLNFIKKKIGWRDISFLMTLAICFFGLNVGYAQQMSVTPTTESGGAMSGDNYYVGAKTTYDVANSGLNWNLSVNWSNGYYVQVTITGDLDSLEVTASGDLQDKDNGIYKTDIFKSASSGNRTKDYDDLLSIRALVPSAIAYNVKFELREVDRNDGNSTPGTVKATTDKKYNFTHKYTFTDTFSSAATGDGVAAGAFKAEGKGLVCTGWSNGNPTYKFVVEGNKHLKWAVQYDGSTKTALSTSTSDWDLAGTTYTLKNAVTVTSGTIELVDEEIIPVTVILPSTDGVASVQRCLDNGSPYNGVYDAASKVTPGANYMFKIVREDHWKEDTKINVATNKGNTVTRNGSTDDENAIYTIANVVEDTDIVITDLHIDRFKVTLPVSLADNYTIINANDYAGYNLPYTFTLEAAAPYSQNTKAPVIKIVGGAANGANFAQMPVGKLDNVSSGKWTYTTGYVFSDIAGIAINPFTTANLNKYTITTPNLGSSAIVGYKSITTTPSTAAGVTHGKDITVVVTVTDEYSNSVPVVKSNNGEPLTHASVNKTAYTYIIPAVTANVSITLEALTNPNEYTITFPTKEERAAGNYFLGYNDDVAFSYSNALENSYSAIKWGTDFKFYLAIAGSPGKYDLTKAVVEYSTNNGITWTKYKAITGEENELITISKIKSDIKVRISELPIKEYTLTINIPNAMNGYFTVPAGFTTANAGADPIAYTKALPFNSNYTFDIVAPIQTVQTALGERQVPAMRYFKLGSTVVAGDENKNSEGALSYTVSGKELKADITYDLTTNSSTMLNSWTFTAPVITDGSVDNSKYINTISDVTSVPVYFGDDVSFKATMQTAFSSLTPAPVWKYDNILYDKAATTKGYVTPETYTYKVSKVYGALKNNVYDATAVAIATTPVQIAGTLFVTVPNETKVEITPITESNAVNNDGSYTFSVKVNTEYFLGKEYTGLVVGYKNTNGQAVEYPLTDESPADRSVYTYTIKGITQDVTIYVEDLTKTNTYTLTLLDLSKTPVAGVRAISAVGDITDVVYDSDFEFAIELNGDYSRSKYMIEYNMINLFGEKTPGTISYASGDASGQPANTLKFEIAAVANCEITAIRNVEFNPCVISLPNNDGVIVDGNGKTIATIKANDGNLSIANGSDFVCTLTIADDYKQWFISNYKTALTVNRGPAIEATALAADYNTTDYPVNYPKTYTYTIKAVTGDVTISFAGTADVNEYRAISFEEVEHVAVPVEVENIDFYTNYNFEVALNPGYTLSTITVTAYDVNNGSNSVVLNKTAVTGKEGAYTCTIPATFNYENIIVRVTGVNADLNEYNVTYTGITDKIVFDVNNPAKATYKTEFKFKATLETGYTDFKGFNVFVVDGSGAEIELTDRVELVNPANSFEFTVPSSLITKDLVIKAKNVEPNVFDATYTEQWMNSSVTGTPFVDVNLDVETVRYHESFQFEVNMKPAYTQSGINSVKWKNVGEQTENTLSGNGGKYQIAADLITGNIEIIVKSNVTDEVGSMNTYTVSFSNTDHVTMPGQLNNVRYNTTPEFAITLAKGYTQSNVVFSANTTSEDFTIVDLGEEETETPRVIKVKTPAITNNATISVSGIAVNKYDVNFEVKEGEGIATMQAVYGYPAGGKGVEWTKDFAFMINVNPAYSKANMAVFVNGGRIEAVNNIYTIPNIVETKSVVVSGITKNNYTVVLPTSDSYTAATAPGFTNVVKHGDKYSFTITPNAAYSNSTINVMINGKESTPTTVVAGVHTYVIESVEETPSIVVIPLTINKYTVTLPTSVEFEAVQTGSSSPVDHGGNFSFVISKNAAYSESPVVVRTNGAIIVDVAGVYTIKDITADQVVTVAPLTMNTYTVVLPIGEGFIATGATTPVKYGDNYNFTVTAKTGYNAETISVRVDGKPLTATAGEYIIANVTSTPEVTVTIERDTYTVTLPSGDGYVATGSSMPVVYGENYTFNVTVTAAYDVNTLVVKANDKTLQVVNGVCTIYSVTENQNVVITVEKNVYRVTLPSGTGYTAAGASTVEYGENYEFTVTLETGYSPNITVMANNLPLTNVGGKYIIYNVKADQNVVINNVIKNSYDVILVPGAGYTITPLTTNPVLHGASYKFTVAIENGYDASAMVVKANGVAISGTAGVYTINNVTTDQEVTVEGVKVSVPNTYTVTLEQSEGALLAAISASPVTEGGSFQFTATLNAAYSNSNMIVKANGTVINGAAGVYTINNITANQTVTVEGMIKNSYSITVVQTANGTISPSTTTVEHGSSKTFTIAAAKGYIISGVSIDGIDMGQVTEYTFSNIVSNHVITAEFTLETGVNDITGIEAKIYSYRNTINIVTPDFLENAKIQVVDIAGRIVESAAHESTTTKIDIQTEGVYIVRLMANDNIVKTQKVIINK